MQYQTLSPITLVPMFLIWGAITVIALVLVRRKKLGSRARILLLIISAAISGFLLGAIPNPLLPIQQISNAVGTLKPITTIIPFIIIIGILLGTSFLVGRAFCSYACPLGAVQELFSKIKFSSKINKNRTKKIKNRQNNTSKITRWIFLAVFVILSAFASPVIVRLFNPFMAFSALWNFIIPVSLILMGIFIAISITSIFAYRPWCRFFCPYGALASEFSKKSIIKLRRAGSCTDCGICERICPTDEAGRGSAKSECYLCNRCVDACPQNSLEFKRQ